MATQAHDADDWEHWTDEERAAHEQIVMERLRAAGVRFATRPRRQHRVLVKARPRWLAFLVRTFRFDS